MSYSLTTTVKSSFGSTRRPPVNWVSTQRQHDTAPTASRSLVRFGFRLVGLGPLIRYAGTGRYIRIEVRLPPFLCPTSTPSSSRHTRHPFATSRLLFVSPCRTSLPLPRGTTGTTEFWPALVSYKTPSPSRTSPPPLPSMVAHWKTDPIMDNPLTRPSTHGLSRPQVFVKLEFGVSWSAQHAPRKHGLEFKSRALRERATHFPRHVPAPTTNYLANAVPQHQYAHPPQDYPSTSIPGPSDHRRSDPEQTAAQLNLLPPEEENSPFFQRSRSRQVNFAPEPEIRYPPIPRRRSRATVRSPSLDRHDRGHSAPPPLSDNNWDVVHSQTAAYASTGSSTACATSQRPKSDVWKDLPDLPSRFRLGEEDLPWEGTWTFPMGWEPFLEPDPYLQPSSPHSSRPRSYQQAPARPESRDDELPSTPTVVKIESPVDSPRLLQHDPSRRSDLEALGSAMMTVDNGFENQWWNQGQREVIPAAAAVHPPRLTSDQAREQMALGWVGALLPPGSDNDLENAEPTTSPNRSNETSFSNMVVSPISSYSGPVPGLSRALSTRSDELWFSSPRFA